MAERSDRLDSRKILIRALPKKVGEEVNLSDGTRYIITGAFGVAKLMHTVKRVEEDDPIIDGGWFNYWHDARDSSVVIAHGGKTGFRSYQDVMHQQERVIFSKTGQKMVIPKEERQSIPPEELVEGRPPGYNLTFPGIVEDLEKLEIDLPGEQHLISHWIETLQRINRDLPEVTNHGELTRMRESLATIALQMDQSTNPYKKEAGQIIALGLRRGGRADILRVANQAQFELLRRSEQIVNIVLGTMQRYHDLELVQIRWNEKVSSLKGSLAEILNLYRPNYREYVPGQKTRAFSANMVILENRVADLEQLTGEPYYSQAQKIIKSFGPIGRREARLEDEVFKRFLERKAKEVNTWYSRLEEQHTGVNLGKYETKKS